MSNNPRNTEQDSKIELTPTQQNPGAAKPTDFKIIKAGESFHVEKGDDGAEHNPIPDRNIAGGHRKA
jgi:hypothetical protein